MTLSVRTLLPSLKQPPIAFNCRILFFLINLFIYLLFIFGCIGPLLLRAAFSCCGERGLLFIAVCRLLIAVASLVAELGL